jgi:hypothetical protein
MLAVLAQIDAGLGRKEQGMARLCSRDWPRFMFGLGKRSARWEIMEKLVRFPTMLLTAISWVIQYGIPCAAIRVSRKMLTSLAPKETASK